MLDELPQAHRVMVGGADYGVVSPRMGQAAAAAGSGFSVLACLGILLTSVYVAGLIFRPTRQLLGMGVDSVAVLGLYGLGIACLIAVASG